MKVLIIAEAGVNHNKDIDLAYKLVDAAKSAGADVVKFQAAIPSEVVTEEGIMAPYQVANTGKKESQLEMSKRLTLDLRVYKEISAYCNQKNIIFAASSFGKTATEYLSTLNIPFWKIPSGEITNLPYLRQIAKLKCPVILSTGMATLGEIEFALNILERGGVAHKDITVLHCTTDYPAPLDDVNLNAMKSIAEAFQVAVGYSDHTNGIEIAIAAVALGATVIEKHLTLDRNMEGPDHMASLEPHEFTAMVQSIRNIESALGNGIKAPSNNEIRTIPIVRRSIVAAVPINDGEVFSEKNLTVKRPGIGISPLKWDKLIGRKASRSFKRDELITW